MTDLVKLIRSIPLGRYPTDAKNEDDRWFNWAYIMTDAADEIARLRDVLTKEQYKEVYGKKRKK